VVVEKEGIAPVPALTAGANVLAANVQAVPARAVLTVQTVQNEE